VGLTIVHLSTADIDGGSARSAYRIHDGLRRRGHVSRMLVGYKHSSDPDVATVSGARWLQRADEVANRISQAAGLQYLLVPSTLRSLRHPWLAKPDVVQLYNIHLGCFSYLLLPALARRAPIVWRLSDQWPMTGHCAYSGPCERWRTGCGACPDLKTFPGIGIDTTALAWRLKRRTYGHSRITVVAPSSWTESIARASPLFAGCAVHRIPNGLDLEIFRPMDRAAARTLLGLPQKPKAILFSAQIASDNPRKGTDLLRQALTRLGPRDDLIVVIAGKGAETWQRTLPQRTIALGYLSDNRKIAASYAACDLLVAPSTVENLPNSVLEAMACGMPVVATDVGGMKDAVRNGTTGLLAPAGNAEALAASLATLLDDDAARARMGEGALALMRAEFSAERETRSFETLYRSLTARASDRATAVLQ
jgi:glycosyltransferase involved in cell wall biosynthesis